VKPLFVCERCRTALRNIRKQKSETAAEAPVAAPKWFPDPLAQWSTLKPNLTPSLEQIGTTTMSFGIAQP
jgi:hypothetical protein